MQDIKENVIGCSVVLLFIGFFTILFFLVNGYETKLKLEEQKEAETRRMKAEAFIGPDKTVKVVKLLGTWPNFQVLIEVNLKRECWSLSQESTIPSDGEVWKVEILNNLRLMFLEKVK